MMKNKRLSQISLGNLNWINVEDPSTTSMNKLEKQFGYHHLDLEDCLEENQRSKIDKYTDYTFIILHFPEFKGRGKKYIASSEINVFIQEGYLVTIHDANPYLNEIFEACKSDKNYKEEIMKNGSGFLLYNVLNDLFERSFYLVDEINKKLNSLEKKVFAVSKDRNMLQDILRINKDIIKVNFQVGIHL